MGDRRSEIGDWRSDIGDRRSKSPHRERYPGSTFRNPFSPRISILQSPISILQSPISNLQSPISNLQSPISNLQSPISNLQSPISNLQSPISNLQSPISNLQSPISNLQSPISDLQSPISNLQSPISNLRFRLFNLPRVTQGGLQTRKRRVSQRRPEGIAEDAKRIRRSKSEGILGPSSARNHVIIIHWTRCRNPLAHPARAGIHRFDLTRVGRSRTMLTVRPASKFRPARGGSRMIAHDREIRAAQEGPDRPGAPVRDPARLSRGALAVADRQRKGAGAGDPHQGGDRRGRVADPPARLAAR